MEKGKFSQPRPYRDEERQIEEAFRQVTGKYAADKPQPVQAPRPTAKAPEETVLFSPEDFPREESVPEAPAFLDAYDIPEEPIPEPEEPDYPRSTLDSLLDFVSLHRNPILIGLCATAMVLLLAVIGIFAVSSPGSKDEGRILSNVIIAQVNVGGMTKNEAISAVKQATSHTYSVQDMVVDLAGTRLTLSPRDTDAKLDVKAAVNAAYDYGRTGTQAEKEIAQTNSLTGNHTIGLLPYLNLDTDYILSALRKCAGETGSTLTQATYGLEGDYPSLSVKDFDETAAQTLVLTMGTPGISFDVEDVYNQILDAYSLHVFQVTVDDVNPTVEPEEVDLQAVYAEFYVEPVDSSIDLKTFETIPGSYGYGFDLLSAQLLVDAAGYGEVVRIPMIFIEPELMEENFLFRDVLGECRTPLTDNKNRNTNIRLACEAMNGLVLQPGDTFSYNATLGERTEERGYKPAPAYSGYELVDSIGGGICQGSSTLYYCALLADLEIVSRTNHGFPVSYIDYGMDATVSWGGPDLKIRNNTSYPIRIDAQVSGNYVTIQILGTEQRDYYVKMDYSVTATHEPETEYVDFPHDNAEGYKDGDVIRKGVTGYSVKTYKLKYSRETNSLMTKDYEASSRYTTVNKLVARVEAPETTVPETTVPETTVPETTVPETTVPETTVPETTVPETTMPEVTEPAVTDAPEVQTEPIVEAVDPPVEESSEA